MTIKILNAIATAAALVLVSDQHIFGVDGKPILCVPESEMDPLVLRYNDESTHLTPGSGHTPGFGFLFSPETMRAAIPGYVIRPDFSRHPYVNSLSGSDTFLSDEDSRRLNSAMRARSVEEIWYARGSCPTPIVRSIAGTLLYEVKCSAQANYGAIWNRTPDLNMKMPKPGDFVVATCLYEHIPIGPYAGKSLANCSRVSIVDQFMVDYRFQEDNAAAIPQIDSMMRDKVSQWKSNCSIRT
jgi:hypothetical protein